MDAALYTILIIFFYLLFLRYSRVHRLSAYVRILCVCVLWMFLCLVPVVLQLEGKC